jgi:NAD-dependent oxidoreductase involved in siderophore biosynthesis
VGFPSGIVTLLSMNGPVVWNANLNYALPPTQPLFTVAHEGRARTIALLHQQRVAANLDSLAEVAKNIRGGPKPREQTREYLLEVSRAWETLGGFLSL